MGRRKIKPAVKASPPSADVVFKRFGIKPSDSIPLDLGAKKVLGVSPGEKSKILSTPNVVEPQDSAQDVSARGSIAGSLESPYVLEPYSPSVSQTLGEDDSSSGLKEANRSDGNRNLVTSEASSGNVVAEDGRAGAVTAKAQIEQKEVSSEPSAKQPAPVEVQIKSAIGGTKENVISSVVNRTSGPWVGLFKDNKQQLRGLSLPAFDVQGNRAVLEIQDVDEVEKTWGFCLVGFVAGKFPGKEAIINLCDTWNVEYEYLAHSSGWLVFKFPDSVSRDEVIQKGPYSIFGRPLLLKIMAPDFDFDSKIPLSVPVWISLPNLPLNCWNARALGKIASVLGNPISTDRLTATRERISFARVLVEIDPTKELKRSVEIQLPTGKVRQQKVIYENEPKYCSLCKVLGHSVAACKRFGANLQGRDPAGLKNTAPGTKDKVMKSGSVEAVVSKGADRGADKEGVPVGAYKSRLPEIPEDEAGSVKAKTGAKDKQVPIADLARQGEASSSKDADPDGDFQVIKNRKQRQGSLSSLNQGEKTNSSIPGEHSEGGIGDQKGVANLEKIRLKGQALPAIS